MPERRVSFCRENIVILRSPTGGPSKLKFYLDSPTCMGGQTEDGVCFDFHESDIALEDPSHRASVLFPVFT